jgi:hypothetical protein|tara:strand:+ start:253 stop:489 length:237 start_codon:yes stop_codon:yes gene_type:complete
LLYKTFFPQWDTTSGVPFKELAVPIFSHRVIGNARKGSYQLRSGDADIIIEENFQLYTCPDIIKKRFYRWRILAIKAT